jgi:molybdate transport system permease protein
MTGRGVDATTDPPRGRRLGPRRRPRPRRPGHGRGRRVAGPVTGRPPWPVGVLAALAVGFLVLPLVGLVQRAPWRSLGRLLTTDVVADALRLSLVTASLATLLSLLFGVPLAWVLARADVPGRGLLRALVTLPMVLPPVVGGAALLFALGRRGLVGEALDRHLGIVLPYSTAGVVVAEAFVALPFLVVTVEAALRSADPGVEEAAATLGAGRWTTFRRVTVPTIAPSLLAGAVLCWARAFGEFGATLTFAGNLQGRTQTMPLAVYLALERDREAALALSLLQVAVALAVLVALRHQWWPAARPARSAPSGRPARPGRPGGSAPQARSASPTGEEAPPR